MERQAGVKVVDAGPCGGARPPTDGAPLHARAACRRAAAAAAVVVVAAAAAARPPPPLRRADVAPGVGFAAVKAAAHRD